MSTRFPMRRPSSVPAENAELRLHTPLPDEDDAGGLCWVRWIFQSVRTRQTALVFQTAAVERVAVLADWQRFAAGIFVSALAPALLRGWKLAHDGDDAALAVADRELHLALPSADADRSVAAGAVLLAQTRGAKYQAALGRFRLRIDNAESPGHLAMIWSAVAALFQLPPLDLLTEYLREEWTVATQHCPHHEVPQGPLSFSGLAFRALHEAGVMDFSK